MWCLSFVIQKPTLIGGVAPTKAQDQSFRIGHVVSLCIFMLTLVGLWGVPSGAHAQPPPLSGLCDLDGPGQCEKSLWVTGNQLLVTLKNTSDAVNGGFITADAFDLGGVTVISFVQISGPGTFGLIVGPINTSPFGTRQFNISTSNMWTGGGNPKAGIEVGLSATFLLTLSGTPSLTEQQIFDSQVIRFRGFEDGDGDKDQLITPF